MANAFTPAPIDVDRLRTEVRLNVFSGSAHESDAKEFDTRGIVFSATRGEPVE